MKGILIQKVNSEPRDGTLNGTFGKAIVYAVTPEFMKIEFPDVDKMYGVVWDNNPRFLINVVNTKVDVIDSTPVEVEILESAKSMARGQIEFFKNFKYFE